VPLKIMLWYWGRRGGGAQFTLGIARALARHGDVELKLALSRQMELLDAFEALDVPITAVDTYTNMRGFLLGTMRVPLLGQRLVAQARQCDVVLSTMTHLWTPLVAPQLRRAGIAYVPTVHDAQPHPGDTAFAWNWRLRRELQAARAAVALSDSVAHKLQNVAPTLPLIRLPLLACLGSIEPPPRREPSGRLLFFGRVRAYKGLDLLRDAFAELRRHQPSATLLVVGQGDVETCAPGLSALDGVTVENRWVTEAEIPHLLTAADAVVLPYREASQSGIVPQALALGVPVVGTPVGGLVEQIQPGTGGLLAREVTAAALADALAEALSPTTLARLQNEAQRAKGMATDWEGAANILLTQLDIFK
jgi:glycosyltransferase involved in cell wall biosynthesis